MQPEVRSFCFGASIPCHAFDRSKTKNANCFGKRNLFGNGKCELSPLQEGRNYGQCKFLARKSAKLFANTKVEILARKGAKFIANFSATKVTSLPSLSHRAHLTHNIGSAFAFPIIQPGAVKLVLCGHWMHLGYMHSVTSAGEPISLHQAVHVDLHVEVKLL